MGALADRALNTPACYIMHPKSNPIPSATSILRRPALSLPSLAALIGLIPAVHSGFAASQTWAVTSTDANWATTANWTAVAVPGALNVTNSDVATFNSAVSGGFGSSATPIVNDLNRSLGGIRFDTASVGAFTIGSNAGNQLQLTALISAANLTQITADVGNAQVIAAPILLRNGSGSANPTYTFRNNATNPLATLTLSGAQTWNGSATRPTFVILDGNNTGANTISGNIANPAVGQGGAQLTKNGTGTWILSGSNTFTGTASSGIVINGGILGAYNANALGAGSNNNKVAINSGGILQLGNSINLVDAQRLNLNDGGTIQSSGSTTTSATVAVNTAAVSVTLSTVGAGDIFTIGNGANDFTGGTAGTSTTRIAGPGTIFMAQASNYAGGWSINSGTLKAGNATALGLNTTAVAFGAGTTGKLVLNGNNASIGSLATNAVIGTAVVENGAAGTAILTVGGTASTTYEGLLQDGAAGVLALTKSGIGSLSLTGANT
jgi:autotransporter-associated beta strand protein